MEDELVIDENNFNEYFFDASRNKPQKGQIMAKYTAEADFIDGQLKRDVLSLLKKDKAQAAVKVMGKLGYAKLPYDIKICREMTEDLLSGMSDEEILNKNYHYVVEFIYYTKREYVPSDPHWTTIDLLFDRDELNKQLENIKETCENNNQEVDI